MKSIPMSYKVISILLTIQLFAIESFSQNEIFTLKGRIIEANSKTQLLESNVEILSAGDSTVIASTNAIQKYLNGKDIYYTSDFNLNIPKKEGEYIIRVSKKGYETTCLNVFLKNLYKREFSRTISDIYLEKERYVNLDEVVVKATKVKFYLKGDTIVYNADAFQLSEGSMLDNLVRQLPGVELRGEKIFVNGRFVESLLLNGKDFFKGSNGVLLNNLPNYMVNKVAVYEKLGDDSEFLGQEMANDTRYVMDVKLKKKYSVGFSGNVELGAGTTDKYLARLFALRFTNHSRLSVYFNANNMNDDGKPGVSTTWSPSDARKGITTQKVGGLDYAIDDKNKKYKAEGNVQFSHNNVDIKSDSYQTLFLSGGNVYTNLRNYEDRKNFNMSTKHRLYFEWSNVNLELSPEAQYRHNDSHTNYASASFNQDFLKKNDTENDIFGKQMIATYRPFAINRNMRQSTADGYEWQTGMAIKSRIKFNRTPDNVTLYACGSYKNSSTEKFEHNRIEKYSQGNLASVDYKNRFFDGKPNCGYDVKAKATYSYIIKRRVILDLSCSFNRNLSDTWSNLYLLDNIEGWGEETQYELGTLPSYMEYMHTLDPTNSYRSRQTINTSTFEPFFVWRKETGKSVWNGQLAIPVSIQNRRLSYRRDKVDTTLTKQNILMNIYSSYIDWVSKDRRYNFKLQYMLSSQLPNMNMYLNIYDTTDPLNITMGNSNLKTSLSHRVITTFKRIYPEKRIMLAIEGVYQLKQNSIAMGYTYDKATGIKTYRPDNVNGCWSGDINIGAYGPIDKRKKLNLKIVLGTGYVHSVDLIRTKDNTTSSSRSVVGTHSMTEQIHLYYTIGKSQIGIMSNGTYRRSYSQRDDFTPINALDMKNGFTAQIKTPWHFSVGTDLMLYSRCGYSYENMNTTDVVWNAQLSYPLLKGKMLLKLDGYDILKQLSNVNRIINAQGIVETHNNIISQYVMLHMIYRFSKSSKKVLSR